MTSPGETTDKKQSDPLFDQWQTYAKLVTNNHMFHREFFGALADSLNDRFSKPVRILDLGCGDAAPVAYLLEKLDVRLYLGIDESEAALALAAERLTQFDVRHQLRRGNMSELLKEDVAPFEVILSSYALHHLRSDQKAALLGELSGWLAQDGLVAVIDIFRREGESRQSYLQAWIDHARQNYSSLDEGELEVLFDHVTTRDFPESPNGMAALGAHAGLPKFRMITTQDNQLAGVATLSR